MHRFFLSTVFALGSLIAFLQPLECEGSARGRADLPEDLQNRSIVDHYLPSNAKHAGLLRTVIGRVVVLHADTNEAYFAREGDRIYETDHVFTLEASRCRLEFTSKDVITMGEKSRISIEAYLDEMKDKEKSFSVRILYGKATFYVLRLLEYNKITAAVKTPTIIIGVRGTTFGVQVTEGGTVSEITTLALCFEGLIEVYAIPDGSTHPVAAGRNMEVGLKLVGRVEPTPPGMAERFMSETAVPEHSNKDNNSPAPQNTEDKKSEVEGQSQGLQAESAMTDVQTKPLRQAGIKGPRRAVTDPTWPSREKQGYFSSLLLMHSDSRSVKEDRQDVFLNQSIPVGHPVSMARELGSPLSNDMKEAVPSQPKATQTDEYSRWGNWSETGLPSNSASILSSVPVDPGKASGADARTVAVKAMGFDARDPIHATSVLNHTAPGEPDPKGDMRNGEVQKDHTTPTATPVAGTPSIKMVSTETTSAADAFVLAPK